MIYVDTSSALLILLPVTFLTHDARLAEAARREGLTVMDPAAI